MAGRRGSWFLAVTLVERSVLSELAQSFGVAVVALTSLLLVEMVYEAVLQGLPFASLARFIPLMVPYALPWTIPAAFVAACLMTYSRMAGSNELTVVRASGTHIWRPLAPAAMMAAALCTVCGLLNHELVPRTAFFQYAVVRASNASQQAAAIKAADPLDPVIEIGKNYRIYMGDLRDDGTFRDITIVANEPLDTTSQEKAQRQVTYLRAPKGYYKYSDERAELVFHLEADLGRATPDDPDAGSGEMYKVMYGSERYDFDKALFEACTFRIKLRSLADMKFLPQKGKHLTSAELFIKIKLREAEIGSGRWQPPGAAGMSQAALAHARRKFKKWRDAPRSWRTEIHKRSALSLAPLLLGAIAIPIGVMMQRGHRLAAFGLAVAIVLGYYAVMAGGWKLGNSGMLPSAVAMWGVTALVGGCGLVLMRKMFRR